MHVVIHAVNAKSGSSRGKTSSVPTNDYQLSFLQIPADSPSAPEKFLQIRAKILESQGTGERGGENKTIARALILEFSEADLDRIFRFALRNGLAKSELRRQVRGLHEQLLAMADTLSVRLTRRSTRTSGKRRAG